jgi:glycosyltransferase involved in cell wall biosynthesis
MKVTVLYNGIHPSPGPMSKRLGLYVRGLQQAGVDAAIITTHRPAGSAISAYTNPFLIPFQVKKEHHALLKQSDVILVDGFNWFTYFWLGFWYGDGKRKLLYELNEKPGTVYTSRLLELKPVKALGMMLTRWSMKSFDGFVVISEPLREFINGQMKRTAKIVKLPIIIDTRESFQELPAEIPPHPFIIHTGALSQQKDGIIDVFKAFAEVNKQYDKKLHFYLAGSKDAPPGVWDEINKAVNDNQLQDNVHFLGMIFGDKLKTLQKNCLFLVLPKPDNEQNRNNFPTKLGEYLAFSRPVITSKVGDMALFMKNGETALIVEPGNVAQISDAMLRLLKDPSLVEKLGAAGRKVAEEEFDYTILGKRLADFCKTLNH